MKVCVTAFFAYLIIACLEGCAGESKQSRSAPDGTNQANAAANSAKKNKSADQEKEEISEEEPITKVEASPTSTAIMKTVPENDKLKEKKIEPPIDQVKSFKDVFDLPSYLFNNSAAQKLVPLVKPLNPGFKEETPTHVNDPVLAEVRTFLQDFVKKSLAIDFMKPGRTVNVFVVSDQEPNASASDLTQSIVFNSGILFKKTSSYNAGTLCHEVGHIIREHVASRMNLIKTLTTNQEYLTLYGDIDLYLEKQHNQTTGVYRHDKAAYAQLVNRFQKVMISFGNESRTTEAEADVVGAMFCAKLGFTYKEYLAGYEEDVAAYGSEYPKPFSDRINDRASFIMKDREELAYDVLFNPNALLATYPTTGERVKQLKNLENYLKSLETPLENLAEKWRTEFPKLVEKHRPSQPVSTSLTDHEEVTEKLIGYDLSTGEPIKINRPKSHPGHELIRPKVLKK